MLTCDVRSVKRVDSSMETTIVVLLMLVKPDCLAQSIETFSRFGVRAVRVVDDVR